MDFRCQGQFWLPRFDDKPVFGTITFSRREGAQLSLADSLPGSDGRREFETIQGQTASGAYVTLLHAICTSEPLFALTPTRPCWYDATFLVIGAALDGETDMRFSLWQLRIQELKWWVGRHVPSRPIRSRRQCRAGKTECATEARHGQLHGATG